MSLRYVKVVRYHGEVVAVGCDGRCGKAWGISARPLVQLGPHPDDHVYRADAEIGEAPADPGTYEGGHAKPGPDDPKLNKWCVRECERSAMAKVGEDLTPPDLEAPRPNMEHLHPEWDAIVTALPRGPNRTLAGKLPPPDMGVDDLATAARMLRGEVFIEGELDAESAAAVGHLVDRIAGDAESGGEG